MPHYIYGLYDPRIMPIQIRYIGYTGKGLAKRLTEHLYEARINKSSYRLNWIRSLLKDGIKPNITIVEEVFKHNWQERERHWISNFGRDVLTNTTAGGEGLVDAPPELRALIAAKNSITNKGKKYRLGIKHSEQDKANISAGVRNSEKFKQSIAVRVSDWRVGIEAARKACTGAMKSEEHKKKISEAMGGKQNFLGKKHSNETKKKIGASQVGNKRGCGHIVSSEHKEKLRQSKTGSRRINNGVITKQLNKGEPLPEGWVYGVFKKIKHNNNSQ